MGQGTQQARFDDVGELYDQITEVITEVLGGSLHYGYWRDDADDSSMAQASEQLTDIMIDKLPIAAGQTVLDVGCGTGQPACRLAGRTGAGVVGVTVSAHQVGLANERARAAGLHDRVRFELADAMDLPFAPETFDAAWLFESLPHMADKRQVLRNVSSALRPGSVIVAADLVARAPLPADKRDVIGQYLETFQMQPLVGLDEYPTVFRDAGLEFVELIDVSDQTARTYPALLQGLQDRAAALSEVLGAETEWLTPMRETVSLVSATPEVGYALFVARKPTR